MKKIQLSSNLVLKDWNISLLKSSLKQGRSLLILLFHSVLEVCTSATRVRNIIQIGNEEMKLSLFTDDMNI